MKKYYYIEVLKNGKEEDQLLARFATTYGDMRLDASEYEKEFPDHDIRMVIASQPEKVFNHLKLQSA